MKRILSTILLTIVSTILFAQDGHIIYNEHSNYKMFGRDVPTRTNAANLDTLTSVYSGTFAFDTAKRHLTVHDGAGFQEIAYGRVRDTSITIATAAVLTLNSSPVTLVPAPGAGYAIEMITASARVIYNTTPYATNTTLQIIHPGGTTFVQGTTTTVLAVTEDTHTGFIRTAPIASGGSIFENSPLTVNVFNGDPTAGDSDIKLYIRYRIIEL